MSDSDPTHAGPSDAHPAADDHVDHGHEAAGEPLGPIDVRAWAYAIGGGLVGLLVALVLFAARG